MRVMIVHSIPGRIRFQSRMEQMSARQADALQTYLMDVSCVSRVKVYERTGSVAVWYDTRIGAAGHARSAVIRAIKELELSRQMHEWEEQKRDYETGREMNLYYKNQLTGMIVRKGFNLLIIPTPISKVITLGQAIRYVIKGLRALLNGRLEVAVLDAAAIAASLLQGDFSTASSVMFLLRIGDLLEEWTHKKSVDDLARSLSLNIDRVWIKGAEGEIHIPLSRLKPEDQIIVRMGNVIPVDGVVISGDAMVNQASLTGEPIPVPRQTGYMVYAGTVIEEGELVLTASQSDKLSRYEMIVRMIESNENIKSQAESWAEHMADALVPYSFLGTLATFALSRNVTKALSILMVDFSCAIKLSMPLAILSAMRECGQNHIMVKGGRYLEAIAAADTIVFDKTGTLTKAQPTVAEVITFGDRNREDMLRLAACLEEHFPHSIANAVVAKAQEEDLAHREMHAEVEYVVAHGIASMLGEERVLIGSAHFIFEDEQCCVPVAEQEKFARLPVQYSHLYLTIGGELAAVICIEDPLKPEVPEVIRHLKALGITKAVMLTGDSERTARAVARQIGVDDYRAGVLPEEKAVYIETLKAEGHKIIMVGDGINDSPALSAAHVGIAMSEGAQITREIADIAISSENLESLLTLRDLSDRLMKRVGRNYRFVVGFNSGLIGLGLTGVITPATSALLHNVSTIGISLNSMTNLMD